MGTTSESFKTSTVDTRVRRRSGLLAITQDEGVPWQAKRNVRAPTSPEFTTRLVVLVVGLNSPCY